MYSKIAILSATSLMLAGCSQAYDTHPERGESPLANAAYQNRLLVICTGDDTGPTGIPMYGAQYEAVSSDWAGYHERDLIFVWLRDNVLTNWTPFRSSDGAISVRQLAESEDTANLRQRTNCKPGNRGIHLIGKDTGLKKSWSMPLSNQEVFALIDAMPMRQSEMQRAQD
jgi:hypothetical protein